MVEDNQIKATVSPFAIREGEIKVFDGKDGYVSMNHIYLQDLLLHLLFLLHLIAHLLLQEILL